MLKTVSSSTYAQPSPAAFQSDCDVGPAATTYVGRAVFIDVGRDVGRARAVAFVNGSGYAVETVAH